MGFPISNDEILKTEKKLNIVFPSKYNEKMMEDNGGSFETEENDWSINPLKDTSDRKKISRTCNDIVLELNNAKEWSAFSDDYIPIAQNGCGDYLIFKKSKDGKTLDDSVYFWSHEEGTIEEQFSSVQEIPFD